MELSQSDLNTIRKLAELPRHLISEGFDQGLMLIQKEALAQNLDVKLHKYKTGYDCGTWIIPKRWELIRGYIKTLSGEIILDSKQEPLSVYSYSLSISKRVSRDELKQHLTYLEYAPEAIPFIFKYYNRDWGFTCTKEFYQNLQDDEYYVEIQTEEIDGELKVLEISSVGKFEETFLLESHMCHPFQINDGPIATIPLIKLLASLNNKSNYSYKLLVVPEQIGSAAWISNNKSKLEKIVSGLFVEMIGTDLPIRLNKSWAGNTIFDSFFSEKLKQLDSSCIIDDFVFANDERQFNGPGIRVPMLGLNRSHMSRHNEKSYAFDHYHTNMDNFENINQQKFIQALLFIEKLIYGFDEELVIPINNFDGEPFLTRYDLHLDVFANPNDNKKVIEESNLQKDLIFSSGTGETIFEIASNLKCETDYALKHYNKLYNAGLVEIHPIKKYHES